MHSDRRTDGDHITGDKSSVFACKLDVHGSVLHNTNLIEMTNKMQLCRAIYYSIVH